MQEKAPHCSFGSDNGEERTLNMACMVVTREVSKLSGWLNADADCRESKGRHRMRSEYTGYQAGGGGRPRRTQCAGKGSIADWGHRARGGAHPEHVAHICDARGVEAQRLVECRSALPRVEGS